MKKVNAYLLAGALLAGVLLAGCSGEQRISRVVAFGDDFTNTDNCVNLLKEQIAQGNAIESDLDPLVNVNWNGRLTNGPVAVEVMAEKLGLELKNYAVCAAASGVENLMFDNAGLVGQIDKFEAELNGEKADPNALYFIEIGITDFYLAERAAESEKVIANIVTAVTRLAGLGAKRIVVGNSLDLNNYPGFKTYDFLAKVAEQYSTQINTNLPVEMEKLAQDLNIRIDVFDLAAVANKIRSNPDQFGLTQLEDPCTQLPMDPGEICENPDQYYFWGYYYLTRVVHRIMGEAMAEQLSQ
jgi:phospholipase/lecithinase/hemolysin